MSYGVLRDDWSDYDNKKIRENNDRSIFDCHQKWEVDYLVKKLNKRYPFKTTETIRSAISSCCKEITAPISREAFIGLVTRALAANDKPGKE